MITTITFLIVAACGVGVGVGVGVDVGEFFTPPHPIVRARSRGLKKNKAVRFKGTAPLRRL
jgi:ABC-type transporter Mla subunit MlaD